MEATRDHAQTVNSYLENASEEQKARLEALWEKVESDTNVPEEDKEDFFARFASRIIGASSIDDTSDRTSDEAWKLIIDLVKNSIGIHGVWILADDVLQPRLRYSVGDGTGKRTEITIIYDLKHDCIRIKGGYHFRVSSSSMAFAKSYACKMTYQWRFTSMCLDENDGEIYVSLCYPWKDSSAIPQDLEHYINLVTIAALEEYEDVIRYANDDISSDEVVAFVKDVQKTTVLEAISKYLDEEA